MLTFYISFKKSPVKKRTYNVFYLYSKCSLRFILAKFCSCIYRTDFMKKKLLHQFDFHPDAYI